MNLFSMEIKQIEMVFDLMATGQSLRASCREFSISPATFLRHVNADADLAKRYEQARAECMDAIADEIIEIADDDSDDLMVGPNGRGQTPNAAAVARVRPAQHLVLDGWLQLLVLHQRQPVPDLGSGGLRRQPAEPLHPPASHSE